MKKTATDKKNETVQNSVYDWAYDTRMRDKRSIIIAWSLTSFFAVLALVSVIAVSVLTPLKENVPFVFTIDNNTGILEPRTMQDTLHWSANEAEDKSNVANYIKKREGYIESTYTNNYEEAVRQSTGLARKELVENYAPDALNSPMLLMRDKAQVNLRFKSLNYHGEKKNVVIARYIADTITPEGVTSIHYIATVQFDYADNEALSLTTRLTNPHAFVVTNYQNTREGFQQ